MKNRTFMKFYYNGDKNIHDISEIEKKYEKNPYSRLDYKGKIYCPECKVAKLCFTRKTKNRNAYLSTLPSSEHAIECSFCSGSNIKQQQEYMKTLSCKDVEDKLITLLDKILNSRDISLGETSNNVNGSKNSSNILINNKIRKNKILLAKPINSITLSDVDSILFIYGTGKISTWKNKVSKNKDITYLYNIATKKNNRWGCRLSIFTNQEFTFKENVMYDFAILGKIVNFDQHLQIHKCNYGKNWFEFREVPFEYH